MGLKLCSECTREEPKMDLKSSSGLEEDNSTGCIRYPSKEKLKTQFSSVKVKPLKIAKLNIDIKAGSTITPETSAGALTTEVAESPTAGRLTRGRSLRQKLTERKLISSCPQTPLGYYDEEENQMEKEAKLYSDALEDNSLIQAKEARSLTESMVEKGAAIATELRREGEVIRKANRDMHKTEDEINQARHTLNGMTLHGKIANYWRRKPKQIENPLDNEGGRDYLPRSISLPAKFAYRSSSADTKQQQIKDNVKQMIYNMDMLREQNEGIAEELISQEPHLQLMSDNMTRVQNEIVRQTTRISEMH